MHSRSEVPLTIDAINNRVKEAEDYYKNLEPLIFRREGGMIVPLKKDNTAKSFVKKFIVKFNEEFRTFYKKSNNLYTTTGTRRSAGDVFRCAYSYLGDKITLTDILIELTKAVDNEFAGSNTCQQINKRVYKDRGKTNGSYFNTGVLDEFGFTRAHYNLLISNHE